MYKLPFCSKSMFGWAKVNNDEFLTKNKNQKLVKQSKYL